jgi:hypothetical protein
MPEMCKNLSDSDLGVMGMTHPISLSKFNQSCHVSLQAAELKHLYVVLQIYDMNPHAVVVRAHHTPCYTGPC